MEQKRRSINGKVISSISHKMKILSKLLSKPFWSHFAMQEMTFGSIKVFQEYNNFWNIFLIYWCTRRVDQNQVYFSIRHLLHIWIFFVRNPWTKALAFATLLSIITPFWSNLDLSNKICVLWLLRTHGPVIDKFGHPGGILALVPGGIITLQCNALVLSNISAVLQLADGRLQRVW